MSGYTKGPWHMGQDGDTAIYGADGIGAIGGRAFSTRKHPEAWANLRLAAAAPELLEELQRARRVLVAEGYIPAATMDAAIAKATGGSHA